MSKPSIAPPAPKLRGLDSAEVEVRRHQFGANVLTPPKRDPWWKLYLEKFDDPVIRILIIAAVVAIGVGSVHGEYIEGLGIIVAVFLATTLAFINEYKANREFDLINQVSDEQPVKVIRDGSFSAVPRKEIVVGDLVVIEAGEEIPADGTLVETVSLMVNESSLTGESEPNVKLAQDSAQGSPTKETTYASEVVLRGTLAIDGHGTFEVTRVGDSTEIGKTARAGGEEVGEVTPLHRQLDRLSKLIGVVGLGTATATFFALIVRAVVVGELALTTAQWLFAGIFAAGVAVALSPVWLAMIGDGVEIFLRRTPPSWLSMRSPQGGGLKRWIKVLAAAVIVIAVGLAAGWVLRLIPSTTSEWLPPGAAQTILTYFMIAVTIIVVAVPEGLAMSVTLSLAYSMRRMAAANTLVRRMHACETIGAATVICSDKTGTLTMNEMRVLEARFPSLDGLRLEGQTLSDAAALIVEGICCNTTAHLGRNGGQTPQALGNPTEAALLLWLNDRGIDYREYRGRFVAVHQLTFSTERKWMGTLGITPRTNERILHVKGAPEIVLERCTGILTPRGVESVEPHREQIRQSLIEQQRRGMRTLGLAYRDEVSDDPQVDVEQIGQRLTWLGFVAIADPVRPDVPAAVEACHDAGIKVKMVTGDNPETAREIARQIGLWQSNGEAHQQLTGKDFQDLPDDQALVAASQLKVLSRAKPLDKVRLVRMLQADGEVVAVTGDGINDCGALNYADVGLAMGRTGKAAAKEASDIVLLDDSFTTIVEAVMWGRSLYENIQRFIVFQLTINVAALCIAFLGPFIGVELPLKVTQMLWVNLIMDTFAALALATEPPHHGVLKRPPRRKEDFIITTAMATNILVVAASFVVVLIALLRFYQRDGIETRELSQFFTIFVMLQFWNLFNARCLGLQQSALRGIWQNKAFLLIAAAIFVGQIVIVQFGGKVFQTVPLGLADWLWIVAGTSSVLWIGEVWRSLVRSSRAEAAAEQSAAPDQSVT